jgi:pSer/pThr/pTyr-binding forkhead associated (FHA) protein
MQKIQNPVVLSSPYLLLTTSLSVTKVNLGSKASWKIGRGKSNDINLPDKSTSHNHAIVQIIGKDEYLFIDLGSRETKKLENHIGAIWIFIHHYNSEIQADLLSIMPS